jgi:hypothetical protein
VSVSGALKRRRTAKPRSCKSGAVKEEGVTPTYKGLHFLFAPGVDARSAKEEHQADPSEDRLRDREEWGGADRQSEGDREPADPTGTGEAATEPGYEPL